MDSREIGFSPGAIRPGPKPGDPAPNDLVVEVLREQVKRCHVDDLEARALKDSLRLFRREADKGIILLVTALAHRIAMLEASQDPSKPDPIEAFRMFMGGLTADGNPTAESLDFSDGE